MPAVKPEAVQGKYDIYPVFNIDEGKIFRGISSLADRIASERTVILDGFSGVFFESIREGLDRILREKYHIDYQWINIADFLKPKDDINELIAPFLGADDPLFGTRTTLIPDDFFNHEKLNSSITIEKSGHYIIYGIGAALFPVKGFLVYVDLPKNELQFRARAGMVINLGARMPDDPKKMYKRFYFIDWVVLAQHKRNILGTIDILVDCQREDDFTWTTGNDFRMALHDMSRSTIRARPWFEPGTWGGNWIKDNISGLNREVENYAWSFELITPENGLILESSGLMLEFSFDFLMFLEAKAILGDCHERFGTDFPIRFDFLDTMEGGNLSIQCHPRPGYMLENFGENFTQEETYYILEAKEDAVVYLGFRENIDKDRFKVSLMQSCENNLPVNIESFVQKFHSHKHDLFLIPYGTIHGSGKNNLVLEISSTPYIFTFKMYDWLRPDLDGKPRPLNISRGMDNLYFDRKGEQACKELISHPVLLSEGVDWQLFNLPTHSTHLYDIWRYHFNTTITINPGKRFHVVSLVEGKSIVVTTGNGWKKRYNFAETFIVPSAAGTFSVENESENPAKLVLAFVK